MMMTTVIHVRDMRPGDIYIGRSSPGQRLAGSRWANPYRIRPDQPRDAVIALYLEYVLSRPELMAALRELRGKRLACWCAPRGQALTADDPFVCHGQVLASLIDRMDG
ncbi:MAG: DUF4326 domain-containing protein [Chloroflexota bacterium]